MEAASNLGYVCAFRAKLPAEVSRLKRQRPSRRACCSDGEKVHAGEVELERPHHKGVGNTTLVSQ